MVNNNSSGDAGSKFSCERSERRYFARRAVEIEAFRIPDVMESALLLARSGNNKPNTPADYEKAIDEKAAMIMRVHAQLSDSGIYRRCGDAALSNWRWHQVFPLSLIWVVEPDRAYAVWVTERATVAGTPQQEPTCHLQW